MASHSLLPPHLLEEQEDDVSVASGVSEYSYGSDASEGAVPDNLGDSDEDVVGSTGPSPALRAMAAHPHAVPDGDLEAANGSAGALQHEQKKALGTVALNSVSGVGRVLPPSDAADGDVAERGGISCTLQQAGRRMSRSNVCGGEVIELPVGRHRPNGKEGPSNGAAAALDPPALGTEEPTDATPKYAFERGPVRQWTMAGGLTASAALADDSLPPPCKACTEMLDGRLPPLSARHWLPSMSRRDIVADIIAGISTALMLIPQGVAYATVAELPVVVGLYSSFVAPIIYPLFGTSRQLSVGPAAIASLLTAEALGAIADPDTETARYVELAAMLCMLVGVINMVFGFARLGLIADFLSRPVITGFTSAASLIIISSQLKGLLGVEADGSTFFTLLYDLCHEVAHTNLHALFLGTSCIIIQLTLKYWGQSSLPGKKIAAATPVALIVVVYGTLISNYAPGIDIKVVGEIPSGLPSFELPSASIDDLRLLFVPALLIAFVNFLEALAAGKIYARKFDYTINPSTEFWALGIANFASSFLQSYPSTGALSRTAVNADAGARTPLASVISGAVVGALLLSLTSLFTNLPKCVLSAIVIGAVIPLFDPKAMYRVWKINRGDFVPLLVTFLVSLGAGLDIGIVVGVLSSLGVFVKRTSKPRMNELGYIPRIGGYRSIARHRQVAKLEERCVIIRVESSLFYANARRFDVRVKKIVRTRDPKDLRVVMLDFVGVATIDVTATERLEELSMELWEGFGLYVFFVHVNPDVARVLARAGFFDPDDHSPQHSHAACYVGITAALDALDTLPPDLPTDGHGSPEAEAIKEE